MDDLLDIFEQGTALVCSLTGDEISTRAFLREYGDFYHYNALDGHERPLDQIPDLNDQAAIVRLHERVQDIAYQVYESDVPIPAYEKAGRILPNEAKARIASVARELNASHLLQQIQEAKARRSSAKARRGP